MTTNFAPVRQPDTLEVIANLSNDAVFTPPGVVNAVLDLLPEGVWADPTLRWLDPASKTGVFPREITKRRVHRGHHRQVAEAVPRGWARVAGRGDTAQGPDEPPRR